MIIINPCSENKGGTFEQALKNAKKWYKKIKAEFPGVVMSTNEIKSDEKGEWEFSFTHKVTGKTKLLHIHGFSDKQCEKFVFRPRVYWDGSSTADPKIEDWLTDDFTYSVLYEPKAVSVNSR